MGPNHSTFIKVPSISTDAWVRRRSPEDRIAELLIDLFENHASRDKQFSRLTNACPIDDASPYLCRIERGGNLFIPRDAMLDRIAAIWDGADVALACPCTIKLCRNTPAEVLASNRLAEYLEYDSAVSCIPTFAFRNGFIGLYLRNAASLDELLREKRGTRGGWALTRTVIDICLNTLDTFIGEGFKVDRRLFGAEAAREAYDRFDFIGRLEAASASLCALVDQPEANGSAIAWRAMLARHLGDRPWLWFLDPKPANHVVRREDVNHFGLTDSRHYLVDFDWALVRAPISLQVAVAVFNRSVLGVAQAKDVASFATLREIGVEFCGRHGITEVELDFVLFYHLLRNFTTRATQTDKTMADCRLSRRIGNYAVEALARVPEVTAADRRWLEQALRCAIDRFPVTLTQPRTGRRDV